MSPVRSAAYLAITLMVVIGMIGPAAAIDFTAADANPADALQVGTSAAISNHTETNETGNGTVTAGVGQQLSTIITATSDDTQTGFEEVAFELEFEAGNETERAESVAERAEELRDRATDIRDDYEDATEAYEAGNLTTDEYAQRIATLNARAENVISSLEALKQRSANLSTLELRAAGVNQTKLESVIENLDSLTGLGPSALLQQFLGVGEGSIELETAGGLSIEVESEDGERSREVKRPRDGDSSITVNGSEALSTARAALSEQAGEWLLQKSSVHLDEGYYKFEFGFRTANETGEAEVRVDGSSGEVFRLEEEIESLDESDPADDEDDSDETDDEDDEEELDDLAVVVASGSPGPGAEITIQVLAPNGSGVGNATVRLNDTVVGTTDADGRLTLTLPADEAEIEATRGDADGELEFEFEDDADDDEVYRNLDVSVTIEDETATVTVSFNGSPVSGAKVYANDGFAGKTPANGTVQVSISDDTDELEIEVVKGEFEAELEFELVDGEATQTEDAHEGDGDKIEDEADDGEEDEEEAETPEEDEEDDEDDEETETPEKDEEDDEDEEEETETPEDDEGDEDEEDPETPEEDDEEPDTPEDDEDEEDEATETPEDDEEDDDDDEEETETPEDDD